MKKFEITTENALFLIQAFETNSSNAKSIIKSKFNITDDDFNQIWSNYNFDKLQSYIPTKKKKNKFMKQRNELRKSGIFVDSKNMAIAYPFEEIKNEHEDALKKTSINWIYHSFCNIFTMNHPIRGEKYMNYTVLHPCLNHVLLVDLQGKKHLMNYSKFKQLKIDNDVQIKRKTEIEG